MNWFGCGFVALCSFVSISGFNRLSPAESASRGFLSAPSAPPHFALGWHHPSGKFASVQKLRSSAKVGIVVGGFALALVAAVGAVAVWQKFTQGPDSQASSGMYAFGDLLLGLGIFGLIAIVPFALGLYWLRPHAPFWRLLAGIAVMIALTGPLALAVNGALRESAGHWALLADIRIGLMPPCALALLAAGLFAPQPKPRWILIAAALVDGALFTGMILVKLVLP